MDKTVDQRELDGLRADLDFAWSRVTALEARLARAESGLASTNGNDSSARINHPRDPHASSDRHFPEVGEDRKWPLHPEEYKRYGRQMIMPEIGLEGQLNLKKSRVLIIGLGGLGCPAAKYLVGAGVGEIGLVDDDTVALSNLHRQTLYTQEDVGDSKVESALKSLKRANSTLLYHAYTFRLTPPKAVNLFPQYDIILDCTDHPSSRYFISDAAVLTGKSLISASALRTEGQLMVLNHPPRVQEYSQDNFCYRCVFPKPPPPETITACGEGGILGPVVGIMGTLMATEAIKILSSPAHPSHGSTQTASPSLLLYSAYSNPPFRSMRLKGKRADCIACSSKATITKESLTSGCLDYIAFCGFTSSSDVLSEHERISPQNYAALPSDRILIDVREPVEFGIAHIDNSLNIPFSLINRDPEASMTKLEDAVTQSQPTSASGEEKPDIYFICKLGNDSQMAVAKMREIPGFRDNGRYECKGDIKGGLWKWRKQIDPSFPDYAGFPTAE